MPASIELLVKIVQAVIDPDGAMDGYRHLLNDLKSLHQAMILTNDAIDRYENTPMHQSLTNSIDPTTAHCTFLLQYLYRKLNYYRQSLSETTLWNFWRPVSWNGWDANEFSSLRGELLTCLGSFTAFLQAFDS